MKHRQRETSVQSLCGATSASKSRIQEMNLETASSDIKIIVIRVDDLADVHF